MADVHERHTASDGTHDPHHPAPHHRLDLQLLRPHLRDDRGRTRRLHRDLPDIHLSRSLPERPLRSRRRLRRHLRTPALRLHRRLPAPDQQVRRPRLMTYNARRSHLLNRTGTYLAAAALAAFVLGPVGWLVTTSLKPRADVSASPPKFMPSSFTFSNYRDVLTADTVRF